MANHNSTNTHSTAPRRELRLTPYVQWFLEKFGQTEPALRLTQDIGRALSGESPKDGFTLASAPTFLLRIIDPASPGGPERIIVWHGPSEGGAFFKDSIVERTAPAGIDFN